MTDDRPGPKIPQVMGQRYEILRRLREEPWGDVWLAQDNLLGVEVGLKLLSREDPNWDQAQARFRQEAALALRLRHPQILGVFHLEITENLLFLVQEPFPGESLLALLTRHQRFSVAQALDLLEKVGQALAAVHGQGLASQALSPLHILVKDGDLRLANLAFPGGDEEQAIHLELKAYDPPEVIQGEDPFPASNVFSLGVLGFRLVAGSLPYPLTFDEPFPYRLESAPVDLEEIPVPLQNVLLQCLAVEPEERLPDAAAFLMQLRHLREQWRSVHPEKWMSWEPPRRREVRFPAIPGGELWGKLWAGGKSGAGKVGDFLKTLGSRFHLPSRRFLWGLGLAGFLVVLYLYGYKGRSPEVAPPPAPPTTVSPLKGPGGSGGPPVTESEEAAPTQEPTSAAGPPAGQPPETAPTPSQEGKETPKEERFMIVAGSFAKKEQAQKLKQRLKAVKIEARVKEEKSGTKTRYLVRVGPVAGTKEADKMERRLKAQGLTPKRKALPARPAPAANSQGAKQ